jgi:hypothetical protein
LVTVNNDADNRVLSATGTSGVLNAETNLTFDGNVLSLTGKAAVTGQAYVVIDANGNTTASTTVDFDSGNVQSYTLNASTTFAFTNPNAGGTYIFIIKQNASSSFTVTWPGTVIWAGGVTPTMTPTVNKTDIYTFVYDGTSYYGSYVQNY